MNEITESHRRIVATIRKRDQDGELFMSPDEAAQLLADEFPARTEPEERCDVIRGADRVVENVPRKLAVEIANGMGREYTVEKARL